MVGIGILIVVARDSINPIPDENISLCMGQYIYLKFYRQRMLCLKREHVSHWLHIALLFAEKHSIALSMVMSDGQLESLIRTCIDQE